MRTLLEQIGALLAFVGTQNGAALAAVGAAIARVRSEPVNESSYR